MIASISLLAEVFHETARSRARGGRQRARVVAARLLEGSEDPAPLFPVVGALDCALVSFSLAEHADALRLLVCRLPTTDETAGSAGLAAVMADTLATQIVSWTTDAVGFATLPAPCGGWPEVLMQAGRGMRSPEPGIGAVVAELGSGEGRFLVLACLLGDQHAGLAQWAPATTIKGV